jgi:hypothetical protein
MARSEMLPPMDRYRSFLDNACPDAVCSLNRLRPNAAQPSPPVSELARLGPLAAMIDRGAGDITKQYNVAGRANH